MMIDYKKAAQACKMLEESGTTYMLAYNAELQGMTFQAVELFYNKKKETEHER